MAEANRDEAEKCLHLCQRFFQEGEHGLALKYAEKSHRLFSSPQSLDWLERLRVAVAEEGQAKRSGGGGGRNGPAVPDSGEPRHGRKGGRQTEHKKQTESREETGLAYSQEQVEEVRRFQRVDKSDFYAVLGVQRGCDEVEVKKAYRKVLERGLLTEDWRLTPLLSRTVGAAVSSG